MKYEDLIKDINQNVYFANLEVSKIKFKGSKYGNNRQIWIYFDKQKYPCGVYIDYRFRIYTQSEPVFVVGVSENDKDYWSYNARVDLLHWVFGRFWIWLKCVDKLYDQFVIGHLPKNSYCKIKLELPIFTELVHDGWSIQKHHIKHLLEMPLLKDMYDWYNGDVTDNLYKNFGYINYYNDNYKELTTEEEFKNVKVGF